MPTAIDEAGAAQRLDETFSALANSVRRAMLTRLAEGPASVNELAEPFDMSLPAISRHVRVLERAGLVSQGREAQFRPVSLEPDALAIVVEWAERQRRVWNERFDQMDRYLDELKNRQQARDNKAAADE